MTFHKMSLDTTAWVTRTRHQEGVKKKNFLSTKINQPLEKEDFVELRKAYISCEQCTIQTRREGTQGNIQEVLMGSKDFGRM